jgi:hypothetical protein
MDVGVIVGAIFGGGGGGGVGVPQGAVSHASPILSPLVSF